MPSWAESIGKYRNLINTQLDYLPIDAIEDFQTIQDALQIILDGSQEPFPKKYQEQLLVIQDLFNSPKENVDLENAEHYGDYKKLIGACIQARIVEFRDKSENEKGQWLWGRSVIGKYTDLINTQLDYLKIDAIEDFELVQNALQIILDLNAAKVILSENTELFPKRYKKYKENLFILHDMLQSPQDYVTNKQNYGKYEQLILERIQARIDEYQNKSESEKQQYIESLIKHREEVAENKERMAGYAKPALGSARHVIDEKALFQEQQEIIRIPDYLQSIMSRNPEQMIPALLQLQEITKDNTCIQTALIFQDGIDPLVFCLTFEDESIIYCALEILLNLARNNSFNQEEIYECFALSHIEKWMNSESRDREKARELFNLLTSNVTIVAQEEFLRNNQAKFEQLAEKLLSESNSTIIPALEKILEYTEPDDLNAVRHIGGISLIVQFLNDSNLDMKLLAIKTLGHLAHNNQHNQNTIRREMGIRGIRSLMESLDDPALTESVLEALSAICENNQNNQISIYNYGIAPIVSLIDSEHHDGVDQLLGYLSGYQPIKDRIREAMQQKPWVDFLKNTNMEVVKDGLKLISQAFENKGRVIVQDAFYDANGSIPVLIKLLEQNDADILRDTALVIAYLAWNHSGNQLSIAHENAIPLLMQRLKEDQDKGIIQYALLALARLIQNSPDNQKCLYQADGVAVLLSFLDEEIPKIVENSLWGLFFLSANNPEVQSDFVEKNGLVALINTLKNDDASVRDVGSHLLLDYIKKNPEHLDIIRNETDIIPTLIKAATPDSVEILYLLAQKNSEIQNILCEGETISWLISCLRDQDEHIVQSAIKIVFELMSQESDIRIVFRNQGGIAVLNRLANAPKFIQAHAASILDHLASGLIETGLYDEGLEEYSFILEHFPMQDYVLQHRGGVYERLGDYENALKDYEEVLKISPNDKAANKSIQRLEVIPQIIEALEKIQKHNSPDILGGLNTLAVITEDNVILHEAIYFKEGISSLVSLLSNRDEEISLVAVKILLNLARDNFDYQMAIYVANAIAPLLSLIHLDNENIKIEVEQLLIQLSNIPELKLIIENAKSFTHYTITLNQYAGQFSIDSELEKNIQQTLSEIADLAKDNFVNQNALYDVGVIPAVIKLLSLTPAEMNTSACAARVLAALAKDNPMNQVVIAEAGGMALLIPLLESPLSAAEAALALAYLVKDCEKNQWDIEGNGHSALSDLVKNLNLKNEESIQNTLLALAYSSQGHSQNQIKIFEYGGIEAIIPLLGSDNKEIAHQAALALDAIMDDNELIQNDIYRVHIKALKSLQHSEDVETKETVGIIFIHLAEMLLLRAYLCLEQGKLDEAQALLEAILDIFSDSSENTEDLEGTNGSLRP